MIRRLSAAVLCLCAGLSGHAAAFTASSSATANDLQFQLIDLNPDDGILPELTISTVSGSTHTFLRHGWDYVLSKHVQDYGTVRIGNAIGRAEASSALGAISASATVTQLSPDYFFESVGGIHREFTLTPYTALIVTTSGELSVERPLGALGNKALVTLFGNMDNHGGGEQKYRWYEETYSTDLGSGVFDLSMRIETGQLGGAGTLSLNSLVHAALPVPEPSTYGMLAAGLLVVGARLRRQRG